MRPNNGNCIYIANHQNNYDMVTARISCGSRARDRR